METTPKLIHKKLIAIMSAVGSIGKNKRNQQQGYAFRGIDDMYNVLHPLFASNGVFVTSEVLESKREERPAKSGGMLIYTIVKASFSFHAEDGSTVSSVLEGEAMDSADKSTNKALSAAMKYALMQMFLIPTEDVPDGDHNTPDPLPKQDGKSAITSPPTDNRPAITTPLLEKAIKRIKDGEPGVLEKTEKAYKLTESQRTSLRNAEPKNTAA